jgi:hypothetical protein
LLALRAGIKSNREKYRKVIKMMPVARGHLWIGVGFLLAAATGSALAQQVPGTTKNTNLPHGAAPVQILSSGSNLGASRDRYAGPAEAAHDVGPVSVPNGTVIIPQAASCPLPAAVPGVVGTCRYPVDCPKGRDRFWHRAEDRAREVLWGIPEEFIPAPLGASVRAHYRTMVANGEAARMVLYHYDFCQGSCALNRRGLDQLAKIVALLPINTCPIIIERTPEAPALAEARRLAVLQVLGSHAIAIAPERVVIGPALANGLSGVEAYQVVYPSFLQNMAVQSQPLPPRSIVGSAVSSGVSGPAPTLDLGGSIGLK